MRLYYIASGILLLLPIIDFAVAAPVLVQEERRGDIPGLTGVGMLRIPEEAENPLWDSEWHTLIDVEEDPLLNMEDLIINPGGPRARPSSSPPLMGTVKQPPPSTPEEPSTVPSPGHVPPSSGSLTESEDKLDPPPGPSGPAKLTMSRLG
jgi:hypothetical protein